MPTYYVFDRIKKKLKTTLIDLDTNAIEFAKSLLDYRVGDEWRKYIDFKIMDMDKLESVGDFDTYILLDSIEHTKNPTKYMQMLVENGPSNANFILSIPIMKVQPETHFHYIEWLNDGEAHKWFKEQGLKINRELKAIPNPKVDYFAELTKGGFYNLIVDASKE